MTFQPLLTAAEVAELLRVDESTILKWEKLGHLRSVVISPPTCRRRTLRFEQAEVERCIEQGRAVELDEKPSARTRSITAYVRRRGERR